MKKGPHPAWTWGKGSRVGPKDEKGLTSGGGKKGSSRQSDQQGQRHGIWKSIMGRVRSINSFEKIRRQGVEEQKKQGLKHSAAQEGLGKAKGEEFVLTVLGNQAEPQVAGVENPVARKSQEEARHPPCQGHSGKYHALTPPPTSDSRN